MGVTPLVVGLTIVAVGTSSPELVVSGEAALYGNSAIALGNVVGSNIGNIALILGIAALVCPMKARAEIIQREMPVMIGVGALLWILVLDGEVGRLDGLISSSVPSRISTLFIPSLAATSLAKWTTSFRKRSSSHRGEPGWTL
jgi:cation:H+ antiporter